MEILILKDATKSSMTRGTYIDHKDINLANPTANMTSTQNKQQFLLKVF